MLDSLRFVFRWVRRLALLLVVLALLAFNVATLTVPLLYTAASGAIAAATGLTTVAQRQAAARKAERAAARRITRKVARRTAIAAGRNVTTMAGEALPVVGVGVIAAATAWEVGEACATMRDLAELDGLLDEPSPVVAQDAAPSQVLDEPPEPSTICGIEPPTRGAIAATLRESPAAAWKAAQDLYGAAMDDPEVAAPGAGQPPGGPPDAPD